MKENRRFDVVAFENAHKEYIIMPIVHPLGRKQLRMIQDEQEK